MKNILVKLIAKVSFTRFHNTQRLQPRYMAIEYSRNSGSPSVLGPLATTCRILCFAMYLLRIHPEDQKQEKTTEMAVERGTLSVLEQELGVDL